jgi:protein-tyrosine phosphatase
MKIAMVCMGNICRSPIAEHVLKTKALSLGLPIEVESSGTGGWHVGNRADHRAEAVLQENGYSFEHRAQQFDASWFDRFELILVMDTDNFKAVSRIAQDESHRSKIKLLRDFDPDSMTGAEVPDPYYGADEDFVVTLKLVEKAVDGLIADLFGV